MVCKEVAGMKTNEERLRKVLQSVKHRLQCSDYTKASRELADIVDYIDHKLRSIDRRPEMDQLVEWLEEKRMTPANTPGDRGWESAFTVVLHHIREMQGITARPREEREDG